MRLRCFIIIIIMSSIFFQCGNPLRKKFSNAVKLSKSKDIEDWEKAIEQYDEIIQLKVEARENQAQLYRKLAKYHFNIGHYNDALHYYKKAIEILPNLGDLHLKLGNCYSELTRSEKDETKKMELVKKAEEEYLMAIKLEPRILEAYYGLGIINFWIYKDYYKGIQYMADILKQDPKNVDAHFALARFYYELDQPGKSLEFYKGILSLLKEKDPRYQQAKDNIQRILIEMQGNYDQR